MIFVGDIALPFEKAVEVSLPKVFDQKQIFGNLEGAVEVGS